MKNVILIITDTFRYDNLGDRAEPAVRTPELDRFAAGRATSVEKFFAGSFPTIPHRTDVATGHLGWPHYGWQPIDESSPNHIGKLFGEAGFATQLICDCPHLFNSRFQFGFDAAFQHRGQENDRPLLHLNDPIETVMPIEKTRYRPFPPRTAGTAMRWLEENYRAGPFFLWVDFFDPHEPWDAPEYMVRRYDPAYDGTPMLHPNYGPSSDYTPEELRNLRAHYCAEAELVDRWVGRVLQKIDDLALWDDTIVVVTADHGFSIGEHERTGKSNIHPTDERFWPIYPEVAHVPFLIAGGDIPKGASLDMFGQPIDILPTLAELSGARLEPPARLTGKSLASALLDGKTEGRDYAVSGCCVTSDDGQAPRKSITPFLYTRQWGYTPLGARGNPELYELANDPLAARDVAADNPDVVAQCHRTLLEHLAEHEAPEACLAIWRGSCGEAGTGSWALDYPDREG